MLRPYTFRVSGPIENHHPMAVVGHHDERIQGDARVVRRNLNPAVPGNPTSCTEPHPGSAALPEKAFCRARNPFRSGRNESLGGCVGRKSLTLSLPRQVIALDLLVEIAALSPGAGGLG